MGEKRMVMAEKRVVMAEKRMVTDDNWRIRGALIANKCKHPDYYDVPTVPGVPSVPGVPTVPLQSWNT